MEGFQNRFFFLDHFLLRIMFETKDLGYIFHFEGGNNV